MCLCNSGIYCWGCVFLTAASPYKGANLSCAGRRQMMSCFLCFSPLSSCCRKAGLEVNTSLCKGRAGAAASGWAGWVLQEQNDGHGISGLAFPLLPPSMGSPSTALAGLELSKSGHSALAQPKVCRAPPELVLLPAREPLTFIKAKFTLTF